MPIQHVIIPVDFSEASIAAAREGKVLAARAGADVELLSVTSTRYASTTDTALRSLAYEQGEDVGHRVITTEGDDIEGRLVQELFDRPDTLWCVGSHGRTAVGEMLFGSVSADLMRDAEVPVVIVGPRAQTRPNATVIAIALDGTPLSEMILPGALSIAGALGLKVRLLQVGTNHAPRDSHDTAYLHNVAADLNHPSLIDFDVLHGDPDDELAAYVERSGDVAMLAMATRGVPTGARFSVPSTMMHVLRHSVVPVLALHPPEPQPKADDSLPTAGDVLLGDERRRIVVGVDTVDASLPAIEWAAAEAARLGAILQILHTWQIPIGPGSMYGYPIWPDIEATRNAALDETEAALAAVAARHPELIVETIVAEGGTVTAVTKQSVGAQMVVLGRHHHNMLTKVLLGSIDESALQRVACPLVIIPCETASANASTSTTAGATARSARLGSVA